ncbi:extracellular solute-binding protein [Acidiphilium sp.]|uniref:extracellular solute-binding protein n=1 Tax=Acidiphilium sp. TaxID=527 RepID=UPI0025834F65|nr:extracellular solute-binding protein [Acidiphilium sp.]
MITPAMRGVARGIGIFFAVILLGGAQPYAAAAEARDFTLAAPPGAPIAALKDVYLAPFAAAAGVNATGLSWDGDYADLVRNAGLFTPWDVVLVTAPVLEEGCARGMLQKLDWNAIGGRERYPAWAADDCGVGAFLTSVVLSWDNEKLQGTPSWADFWDVAKYPGKRGLRRDPRMTLEFALLADGVAAGDVYAMLRTEDGIKRAFRKLDQLRPYIVWWEKPEEATRILGEGKVLMTMAPSAEVVTADREGAHHFGVQWSESLYRVKSFAIVTGSPNTALAQKFLALAGDPAAEARLFAATAYGPLAKGALDQIPPERRGQVPSNPANLKTALAFDENFWEQNGDRLALRFEAWLAQPPH